MKDIWAEEKEADEKLAYKRKVWRKRQRKLRDPQAKRKQKQRYRKNKYKARRQQKQRYKKYKVNPAYKRQRKIQRKQRQRRRRLAYDQMRIKVAFSYLKKIAMKETYISIKDLPDAIKKLFRKEGIRPQDIKVRPSATFSPSEASAYGDGHKGFGIVVDLDSGRTKKWESGWGQIIPDQKKQPIPPNGAVLIGNQGGTSRAKRISFMYVNPANMGLIMPQVDVVLSTKEEAALSLISNRTSKGRKDDFPRYELGEYGPKNQYVQSLLDKGLVEQKGRGIKITTQGKNLAKDYI